MRNILIYCFLIIGVTGCVTPIANFGMVSNQTQIRDGSRFKKIGKCKYLEKKFFLFVYWDGLPSIERAVQGCMEQHKNAAYISTASLGVYQNWWVFFMWTGYQVEGNVYGLAGAQPSQAIPEESFKLIPTGNGLVMSSGSEIDPVVPVQTFR